MLTCETKSSKFLDDAFIREWQHLLLRVPSDQVLFGPAWYCVWNRTWGASGRWSGQLRLLVVRDEAGTLRGILPIAKTRIGPIPVWSMAGGHQPDRPLLADESCAFGVGRAIGEFVSRQNWLALQIGTTRTSNEALQGLIASLDACGTVYRHHLKEPIAIAQTPTTFDAYRQDVLGGRFHRKIGYYERKMQKAGDVEIRHFRQPSTVETAHMLDDLATIERNSWLVNDPDGKPRFIDGHAQAMWTQLIGQQLTPNDQLDCWIQYLDNKPVSFVFSLTTATTRYVLANNYDERVQDFRTGSILYRKMMQDGIERGIFRYDFGAGNLHYKKYWGAEYNETLETYVVFPNRTVGRAVQLGLDWQARLKRPVQPSCQNARQLSTGAKSTTKQVKSEFDSPVDTRELMTSD